jgi:phospholipid/cholesterol/gamma-HCH transport system ATP-binding protein
MDEVHIRVVDLHKSYGPNHVLRGVSLMAYAGRINVVIGGSGAGKTVLMRQVIGLEKPDSGQIVVDGTDIVPLSELGMGPVRRKFGMVFQHAALFDSMTVFDNVAFPLREHTRLGRREISSRVVEKLAVLGLSGSEHLYPADISGGMKKRVGVARALILEPKILIYDEPTTGLDPIAARKVDELIRETASKFEVTSFVISHDMTTTFGVGDYISLLHEGTIRVTGIPEEIVSSTDPEVVRFLRSSGVDPQVVLGQARQEA